MDTTQTPSRRWPLFVAGVVVFLLGPIGYFVQLKLARLDVMPWYVLGLAGVGLVLLFISSFVGARATVLRRMVVLLFALLGAVETVFLVELTKSPEYKGPVHVGGRMPAFATSLADGKPFTNADLESGKPTALVFFRGRW
jgi:hypothetical protein